MPPATLAREQAEASTLSLVLQRQTLADSLIRSLSTLGLQRRGPAPLDLARSLLPALTGAQNGRTAPASPRSAQNGKWRGKDRPGDEKGPKAPPPPSTAHHSGAGESPRRGIGARASPGELGMLVGKQGAPR